MTLRFGVACFLPLPCGWALGAAALQHVAVALAGRLGPIFLCDLNRQGVGSQGMRFVPWAS